MSEEKQPDNIPYGEPVIIRKPDTGGNKGGRNSAGPFVFIAALMAVLAVLIFWPESSSPTSSTVPPEIRLTPTTSPVPTYAPGIPTPTSSILVSGASSVSVGCAANITVGASAFALHDSVRVRRTPGYVGKNDATDTVLFLYKADIVDVRGGPQEADGLCWWHVEYGGVEGWTADHSSEGLQLLAASP
jgi:hypothetical protein